MAPHMSRKALIYCRAQGSALSAQSSLTKQEERCRSHARENEYEVVRVFRDEASANSSARPALDEMLALMKRDRAESYIIVIDDTARITRSLRSYLSLKQYIHELGGSIEMPRELCVLTGGVE